MRDKRTLKTIAFVAQTRAFITFKLLIKNNLKRKQKRLINANRLLIIIAILRKIIINYLVKKARLNKVISILITLMLFLLKNLKR